MDDYDVESDIKEVLPSVSQDILQRLGQILAELGASTEEDLKLVEAADLVGVVTPIYARKLIKHWNSPTNNDSRSTTTSEISSPCSSNSDRVVADWDFQFNIPWKLFSKRLITACENGKRPEKRDRLQMVRVIVDEVLKCTKQPKLKNMERLAYKIVSRYPSSFKDVIDGVAIGNGMESLVTQLMYRCDNLRRSLKNLPQSHKEATATSFNEEDQNYLKSSSLFEDTDEEKVASLMNMSYIQQREDIEKQLSISEIQDNWPFLFHEKYLLLHFEKLLNITEFKKKFLEKFCSGGDSIYK